MVDGPNMYLYCGNDPVNLIDAWGLCGDEFNWSESFWEFFGQGIMDNPPTIGVSATIEFLTFSINTKGFNFEYSPLTVYGASIDIQSKSPITNTHFIFGINKHTGFGYYPAEGLRGPLTVHSGASLAVPFFNVSYNIMGRNWNGSFNGILNNSLRREK